MAFNKIFPDNIDRAYQEEFYKLGLDQEDNFSGKEDYSKVQEELKKNSNKTK